jgi:phosphate transport system substrate-binding protein
MILEAANFRPSVAPVDASVGTVMAYLRKIAAAVAMVLASSLSAWAAETTGAGSTFVYPILAKWAAEYAARTGNKVNYQPIGSGSGIAQIKSGSVDFGASDAPMKPAELARTGIGQFPLVIGGVVPVVNLDGVQPGQIRFTGAVLADIFLGNIKTWDHPAIRKLNPDLNLPSLPVTVVHRSDSSGTTFNLVNYLSKLSADWREKVGEGTSVDWPIGLGGKGNEGVATFVSQLKGAIGYVEYAYVLQKKMTFGLLQNKAGKFVRPEPVTFEAAASSADWSNANDFYLTMTNAPGEDSYPITATTFVIMYKQPKNTDRAVVAMDFFRWALETGQPQAISLGYVPLPASLVSQIEAYWDTHFFKFKH